MRYVRYGTGILLSVVAVVYVLYAVRVFPIPGTDSSSFLPPALSYGQGKGLANPLYYLSHITDPTGQGLYNYYVPVYTWLLGACVAAVPGVKTIFLVCTLMTIIALTLYRRALIKWIPAETNRLFAATVILSVTYLATYSLPTIGRPEQLTAPLLLVLWLLYQYRHNLKTWTYNALLVSLLAVLLTTQVTSFYFAFLLLLIVEFTHGRNTRRLVLINTGRAIAVLMLSGLVLEASPNGFAATMEGISRHSKLLFSRNDRGLSLFAFYWLLSPFNIGFLVVLAAATGYWMLYLRSHLPTAPVVNRWIVTALHVAVAAGIVQFVLRAAPTVYNLTQNIYVLVLFVLLNNGKYGKSKYNNIALRAIALTFLAGTFVFLRSLILFADNEMDGRSYDAAQQKLAEVERKYGRCRTQLNLWSLYKDPYQVLPIRKRYMYPPDGTARPGDIVVMPASTDPKEDKIEADEILAAASTNDGRNFYYVLHPGDIVVVPQAYKDLPKNLLQRSDILEDWRTTNVRTYMHLPISRHPYGYSFVVLRVR